MNKASKDILDRISRDALLIIKSEAEMQLDEITVSENIILGKASSFFQILFAVSISLVGYLITQVSQGNFKCFVNHACLVFVMALFIALLILMKSIYPRSEGLKGSLPRELLKEDIFNESEHEIEMLLSNRISSLQSSIEKRLINQKNRVRHFKNAINTVLFSIPVIVLYSLIYYFWIVPVWFSDLS